MGNKTTNLIWIDYTISSTMYRAYAQICSFDLPHLRSEKIKLIKLQQAYSLRPSYCVTTSNLQGKHEMH